MRDAAISFSTPMVRAILACRKTVTRRMCKPAQDAVPAYRAQDELPFASPYGRAGDRLWIKEAWRTIAELDDMTPSQIADASLDLGYCKPWSPIQYEADGQRKLWESMRGKAGEPSVGRYRHARFMPRWASRITLEIVDVHIERLHDIDAASCLAEGMEPPDADNAPEAFKLLRATYASLWDSLNGPGSWSVNPWVWVVAFKRIK